MKTHAVLAAAALALAACGQSEPPPPPTAFTVSEVAVNTDLQSIGNSEAVQYWQGLDEDLETALAAEFVNEIAPTGALVAVDVNELSMADFLTAPAGSEQARLAGTVTVTQPGTGEELGVYNVSASAAQAASYLPAGADVTTIPRTSQEYYRGVVQAFASGVASTVRAMP